MSEETLKAQVAWCIESIKTIADAYNKKKGNVVLGDVPDTPPPH